MPVEKNTDIPPTDFLQELHSHINPDPFHVYAVIGLPENDVFPTLSYPDYYTLVTPDKDQKKVLSWKSIFDCMLTKYLPLKNTVLPGKDFYDYLVNSGNNMDGTKSVLLYPGRWGGFDLREAQALSQTILTETKFGVFICTQAHPLTTKDNVHEQNPIITGVGMYGVVKEVIFFNGVVGLGEDFLGQIHSLGRTLVRSCPWCVFSRPPHPPGLLGFGFLFQRVYSHPGRFCSHHTLCLGSTLRTPSWSQRVRPWGKWRRFR